MTCVNLYLEKGGTGPPLSPPLTALVIRGIYSTINTTICNKSTICYSITHGIRSTYLQLNIGMFNGLISMYKCNRLQHGVHQALRIIFSNVLLQNCESALLFISILKLVLIPVSNIEMIINLSSNYNEIWFKPKIYHNFILPFCCNHYYINPQN